MKVNREKTIKVVNKVKKLDSVNVIMKQEPKQENFDLLEAILDTAKEKVEL